MDEIINSLQNSLKLGVPFDMSSYKTWGELVLLILIVILVLVIYVLNRVSRLEKQQIDNQIKRNNNKKEQEDF